MHHLEPMVAGLKTKQHRDIRSEPVSTSPQRPWSKSRGSRAFFPQKAISIRQKVPSPHFLQFGKRRIRKGKTAYSPPSPAPPARSKWAASPRSARPSSSHPAAHPSTTRATSVNIPAITRRSKTPTSRPDPRSSSRLPVPSTSHTPAE